MPTTTEELTYLLMSALVVIGITVIGYLLNKGFENVREQLKSIHDALKAEHAERERLSTELTAMRRVCDERHGIPHRRFNDCGVTQ
jgi:hypothetical protein